MKIYLLRHGQTDWNKEEKMAYKESLILNEEGIRQAELVSEKLHKIDYDLVMCSPFIRAKQTAEIANKKQLPLIIDDRLKERNAGVLDGLKISEIDNIEDFYNYNKNVKYDGADDLKEFCAEVWDFLEEIKEKYNDKNLLLVTHNITIRAIKAYILGIPEDGNMRKYGIKNCGLEEYELK